MEEVLANVDHCESKEDLLARHRSEKKELQAQIQKLKHSVPKGDKKKKKEITAEIAKLEADLDTRQKDEITVFDQSIQKEAVNEIVDGDEADDSETLAEDKQTDQRKSKAQKRRDKKTAKERNREEQIKAQEVENRHGPRQLEINKIKAILKSTGLSLYEIPADGNCMYNAINHQLSSRQIQSSNEELRRKTADYMLAHKEEFLPFLTNPESGDMMTEDEFIAYCQKTAKSTVWGGQLELRAMSESLRLPIEVLQADTPTLKIGEDMEGEPIKLVYHRHAFRLGEHYNSVAPLVAGEDGSEDEANSSEVDAIK